MDAVVVDERGRIVIPSKLRKKLMLKKGDTFIIIEVKNDILILKKLNVEKLVRQIAEEVARSGLDLEELSREVEEEANELAKEKVHS